MKTTVHHPINKAIIDRENQAVVEYNILKHVYARFQQVENCSVPRPLIVVPDIETYVMDFVEGRRLLEEHRYARYFSSRKGFDSLRRYYFYCGKWLKHFQEFTGIRTAASEALVRLLERCDHRLGLIEESQDPRCPPGLRGIVMQFLDQQLLQLSGEQVTISGRHGDFGPWNILVGSSGITVLDFFGYAVDPIPVDVLKMLISFEYRKRSLACSARRFRAIRESFLDGFGLLPAIPEPVLMICETMHRVCSVWGCLSNSGGAYDRRLETWLNLKFNLKWLSDIRRRKSLWPARNNP
jgi:hypothetical protein